MSEQLNNETRNSQKNDVSLNQMECKPGVLESILKQVLSKLEDLESTNADNSKFLEALSSKVDKNVSDVEKLNKTIAAVDDKFTTSTKDLESCINTKNEELKIAVVSALQNIDLSVVENKIGTLQTLLQNQYSKLNEERNTLQLRYDDSLQENGKLKFEVESLKESLSVAKKNNDEKEAKITQLDTEISQAKDKSDKLSGDINLLNEKLDKADKTINKNTEEKEKLSSEIDLLKQEVESKTAEHNQSLQQLEKIQGEYNSLSNHYESLGIKDTLLVAFEEFSSLSDKTKASIEVLFPKKNFLGFVAAALRLSNITSLWETAKRNIFSDNLEDIEKINKIFSLLITLYNEGSKENQFQIILPEIGSKYDSSICAIKELKSSGTVKRVHLVGYKNLKDGNVHKAIISVDD